MKYTRPIHTGPNGSRWEVFDRLVFTPLGYRFGVVTEAGSKLARAVTEEELWGVVSDRIGTQLPSFPGDFYDFTDNGRMDPFLIHLDNEGTVNHEELARIEAANK